jgi:fermentation-respiration switch protein FrsA (DUF1100 family)
MARTGARSLRLVGYSGGGVVAALVAARHAGAASLITVAAPLDVEHWIAGHGVSPLTGSLDPLAQAAALRHVPQLHLAGADDKVVPPDVLTSWLQKTSGTCARLRIVPDFDHQCCWRQLPPAELAVPTCENRAR